MALRACVIEGKGDCSIGRLSEYQHIMRSLWEEISDLADFDRVSIKSTIFSVKVHNSRLNPWYYTQIIIQS